MEKAEAIVAERVLLKLWEYAAEIQHRVPPEEAFRLLFTKLDEQWIEAARAAK